MTTGARIRGSNGLDINANADGEVLVGLPKNADNAGVAAVAAEVHHGLAGAARVVRPLDASLDYRLRVGLDTVLFTDNFAQGAVTTPNISKYQVTTSVMTPVGAGSRMVLNSGNSVAANAYACMRTYQTFVIKQAAPLYINFQADYTQTLQANNTWELGFGTVTQTLLDGVCIRATSSGAIVGVISINGDEITTTDFNVIKPGCWEAGVTPDALIVIGAKTTEFWVNDDMIASIETPPEYNLPSMSGSGSIYASIKNDGITSLAQQLRLQSWGVTQADVDTGLRASQIAAMQGLGGTSLPDGVTAGPSENYVNSNAPGNATLSNSAAGYTTIGGKFKFAAVAGAETDYLLFAAVVPGQSATQKGRRMVLRRVSIDSIVVGGAVATTGTTLEWSVGVGSTSASLSTSDGAIGTGGRAYRRKAIGFQDFPVGSAIGSRAERLDITWDGGLVVDAGTYIAFIMKCPVGTATAGQEIRGVICPDFTYED